MRVLFTSPVLEHPAAGGPQLRIENSIKALAAKCELDIVARTPLPGPASDATAEFLRRRCSEVVMARGAGEDPQDRRLVRRVLRRVLELDAPQHARMLVEHAERRDIDIIWFGYGNISYPVIRRVRRLRPGLKLVCDTDSVWSRFVLRELPYVTGARKLRISLAGRHKEREERAWVQLCQVTTAVSEVDADYYRALTPHRERIHLFPNVLDLEAYARPPRPPGFRSPSIYLAGSFGHFHSPMDTAARWVLEKVLPRLLQRHPQLHFYIVGNNSDRGFAHLNGPNITATGRVASVLPFLCHADVALVPLHFESGTRFKILEAAACGVPLVSTTLGAEGIPVVDGRDILLADKPEAFADAILALLDDRALAARLATSCRRLVQEHFSVERLARDAEGILQFLERR
jgi:glycosyltransferase involved in cell wall biosynthesis